MRDCRATTIRARRRRHPKPIPMRRQPAGVGPRLMASESGETVFISNVVSISERTQGNPQSRVLEVEVETERGVRVLTLPIAAARQLHDGFAHVFKEQRRMV
jgi:hypothetical protein